MCACARTYIHTADSLEKTWCHHCFWQKDPSKSGSKPIGAAVNVTRITLEVPPNLLLHSCDSRLPPVSSFSLALSPSPEKKLSHSPCFSPRHSSQIIISRCITILNGIPMLNCIGENLFSKGFLLCNMYVTSSNRNCIIFIVLSLRKYWNKRKMIRAYYSPMKRNFRALLERWNGGNERSPTLQRCDSPRMLCKKFGTEGAFGLQK